MLCNAVPAPLPTSCNREALASAEDRLPARRVEPRRTWAPGAMELHRSVAISHQAQLYRIHQFLRRELAGPQTGAPKICAEPARLRPHA